MFLFLVSQYVHFVSSLSFRLFFFSIFVSLFLPALTLSRPLQHLNMLPPSGTGRTAMTVLAVNGITSYAQGKFK